MDYHVHVYAVKGLVEVDTNAKSKSEAMEQALKQVEDAEVSYHGNYPMADVKYVAVISDSNSPVSQPSAPCSQC